MRSLNWRGWSPESTCPEYDKLKLVAEELLQGLSGAASLMQFAEAQKSLLFLYQELDQLKDPWHPRFPGGHRCLLHCYLEYATRIRNKALLFQPAPPQPQPAPTQPPLTPDAVVNNLRTVADELKRPRDTYLGADEPPPPRSTE